MPELIERLREYGSDAHMTTTDKSFIIKAADELTRLQANRDEWEETARKEMHANSVASVKIARLQALVEQLAERLQNSVYALELWEREALVAGKRPSWAIRPLERGSEEMLRARTTLSTAKDNGHGE